MNERVRETIEILAQIRGAADVIQVVLLREQVEVSDRAAERAATAVMLWLRDHGWDPPPIVTSTRWDSA